MRLLSTKSRSGSALVVTIITAGLVAAGLASYLALINAQNSSVKRAQQWSAAMPVVESGLEEALTHLHFAGLSGAYATNGWTLVNNAYTLQRDLGSNAYYVASISNVVPPVLYASGYVKVPGSTNYFKARTVRARTQSTAMFRGLVAKGAIGLTGNVYMDSFDSGDPNYSLAGQYNSLKRKDGAYLGAVGGNISLGGSMIYGYVGTGPDYTVSGGAVGDSTWLLTHSSGIQTNHYHNDLNVSFTDPNVPFPITTNYVTQSGSYMGTNYSIYITNGNYQLSSVSLSGNNSMAINGNVTLLITNGWGVSGNAFIRILPNSKLTVYVMAGTTSIAGNGVDNSTGNALNFQYFGMADNTTVSVTGNGTLAGLIYAPRAALTVSGNASVVGAAVANTMDMNGNATIHYDENVNRNGPGAGYVVVSWNEI